MWRHFLHHTHARCGEFQIHPHLPCEDILNFSKCGEILEIYTSIIWRNQKFLHMTDFFSTNIICDICDKYEVCLELTTERIFSSRITILLGLQGVRREKSTKSIIQISASCSWRNPPNLDVIMNYRASDQPLKRNRINTISLSSEMKPDDDQMKRTSEKLPPSALPIVRRQYNQFLQIWNIKHFSWKQSQLYIQDPV